MTHTININGESYPVRFGFAALMTFSKKTGIKLEDLDELSEGIDLYTAVALLWAGLKDGARKEKKQFTLSVEDIADLLDDDVEVLTTALELFAQSFAQGAEPGK